MVNKLITQPYYLFINYFPLFYRKMHILLHPTLTMGLASLPSSMATVDLNALNSVKNTSGTNSRSKLSINQGRISVGH